MSDEVEFDWTREARIGIGEAVLCAGKSQEQIRGILAEARMRQARLLLTRLDAKTAAELGGLDYDAVSRTAVIGTAADELRAHGVCIVTAGTADVPVAREAERTLAFHGHGATMIFDVGVAGLHRLTARLTEIAAHPVVIVVAGMDAALASVVAGQVPGLVIGVPTSQGYGAARGGETALAAMLASCAAGLVVCNIDNGFGAACAALRHMNNREGLGDGSKRVPAGSV